MHVPRRLNTPRIHLVASRTAAFTTDGNHKDGYTVGAGLEYMFAPNWSAKLEYQYSSARCEVRDANQCDKHRSQNGKMCVVGFERRECRG
jgi:opacity protein-like surface antigen